MKTRLGIVIVLFLMLSGNFEPIFAQGNLLVAPTRVVFEGAKQKEDLNITNIGQDTAVYLISFLQYKMLEDGSFNQLAESDSLATRCDKFLRVFPRKVALPPGESQTIRLQYRKPADLKDGEYRSHLYFRAEKEVAALGMKTNEVDSNRMSVSITPVFGITIPVIVRNGSLKYACTLSDVSLKTVDDTTSALSFSINRTGERSSYGNLRVDFVSKGQPTIPVGMANGVGVYTDLNTRRFTMNIRNRSDYPLRNGRLVITYSNSRNDGEAELAKTEYQLP